MSGFVAKIIIQLYLSCKFVLPELPCLLRFAYDLIKLERVGGRWAYQILCEC